LLEKIFKFFVSGMIVIGFEPFYHPILGTFTVGLIWSSVATVSLESFFNIMHYLKFASYCIIRTILFYAYHQFTVTRSIFSQHSKASVQIQCCYMIVEKCDILDQSWNQIGNEIWACIDIAYLYIYILGQCLRFCVWSRSLSKICPSWYVIDDKSLCLIKINNNEVKVTFENVHCNANQWLN